MKTTIVWLVLLAGVAGVMICFDPSADNFPKCPFHALTGLFCPGCGSQRAMHALVHAQWHNVLAFNPLFASALIFYACEVFISIGRRMGRSWIALSSRKHTPMIVLCIVVAFWIARNIPAAPFNLLAP